MLDLTDITSNTIVTLLGIVILYPLLTILLSEFERWLQRRNSPYGRIVNQAQVMLLPAIATYILLSYVAGFDETDASAADESGVIVTKVVLTIAASLGIFIVLGTLNTFLLERKKTGALLANIPGLLLDMVRLILVLLGIALIVSYIWSVDLTGALLGLGVGGLVLGLALQDTLSALFAGLSMLSTRNFKEGDWLKAGDHVGKVVTIDWRSVTIETPVLTLVVIPNSELARTAFVVESTDRRPYAELLYFTFAHDDPPESVIRVLTEVATATTLALKDPEPYVVLTDYKMVGVEYLVMLYVPQRNQAYDVRSQFNRRLWYAAGRNNLHLIGAHHRLQQIIKSKNPTFDQRYSALRSINLFDIDEEKLEPLVLASSLHHYGASEWSMEVGDTFNRLQILLEGTLEVRSADGHFTQAINAGDFFVSRAFLNGSAASFGLYCQDECQVIEIPHQAMMAFLDENPSQSIRFEAIIEQSESRLYEAAGSAVLSRVAVVT